MVISNGSNVAWAIGYNSFMRGNYFVCLVSNNTSPTEVTICGLGRGKHFVQSSVLVTWAHLGYEDLSRSSPGFCGPH